jgi:hypothetical protein
MCSSFPFKAEGPFQTGAMLQQGVVIFPSWGPDSISAGRVHWPQGKEKRPNARHALPESGATRIPRGLVPGLPIDLASSDKQKRERRS